MNPVQSRSIACGLPFCQNSQREETKLSIGVRVTMVVLGLIAVIVGITLYGILGLSQFSTVALIACSTGGGASILLGGLFKQIKNEIDEDSPSARNRAKIIEDEKLKKYYLKRNITKGDELVEIEEVTTIVYSSSTDELKEGRLTVLAINLFCEISTTIIRSSSEKSVKERRRIFIATNEGIFDKMDRTLIEPREKDPYGNSLNEEEYNNATYLGCVVNKFIEKGIIYGVITRNTHGYTLQA